MKNQADHYSILQVSRDASAEVIESAYKTIMGRLRKHPDLGGDTKEAQIINEAYEVLSDPVKRADYDRLLGACGLGSAAQTRNNSGVERRRAPRIAVDAAVSYCFDFDLKWHGGRVKDVSELGLKIRSHEPLYSGQHLVILPANTAAAAVHGKVCWVRIFHPSVFERVYEAGVEFSDQIVDVVTRFVI